MPGLSNRNIALVTGVGKSAVRKHVRRAEEVGLDWGLIESMDEEAITALLYAPSETEQRDEWWVRSGTRSPRSYAARA